MASERSHWAVDDVVLVVVVPELVVQPVEVLVQIFEAVDQPPIWPVICLLEHILERDKVPHVCAVPSTNRVASRRVAGGWGGYLLRLGT